MDCFFRVAKSCNVFFISALFLLPFLSFANLQKVGISLTDPDDVTQESFIYFYEDATQDVDLQYDFRRHRDSTSFAFYSKIYSGSYSVQALPLLTDDRSVQFGIDAALDGWYALRLIDIEGLCPSVGIVLEDTQTGTRLNLRQQDTYWFHMVSGNENLRLLVHLNAPVEINATDIGCDGEPATLEVVQPGSYRWNYQIMDDNNNIIDAGNNWNGTLMIQNLIHDGVYRISLTDTFGYTFETEVTINEPQPVVADFVVSDSVTLANQLVFFFDYSFGASDYLWDFGDGTVTQGTAYPSHTFNAPGTYEVVFTALNTSCDDVMIKTVTVEDPLTGIHQPDDATLNIYAANNQLYLDFQQLSHPFAEVRIFNMLGQQLMQVSIPANGLQKIQLPDVTGNFLVTVWVGEKKFLRKVNLQN